MINFVTHAEKPKGKTGWETLCGRTSSSLTKDRDEVDCKICRRSILAWDRHNAD